jgi:hypothetical protein
MSPDMFNMLLTCFNMFRYVSFNMFQYVSIRILAVFDSADRDLRRLQAGRELHAQQADIFAYVSMGFNVFHYV